MLSIKISTIRHPPIHHPSSTNYHALPPPPQAMVEEQRGRETKDQSLQWLSVTRWGEYPISRQAGFPLVSPRKKTRRRDVVEPHKTGEWWCLVVSGGVWWCVMVSGGEWWYVVVVWKCVVGGGCVVVSGGGWCLLG